MFYKFRKMLLGFLKMRLQNNIQITESNDTNNEKLRYTRTVIINSHN